MICNCIARNHLWKLMEKYILSSFKATKLTGQKTESPSKFLNIFEKCDKRPMPKFGCTEPRWLRRCKTLNAKKIEDVLIPAFSSDA